MKQLAITALAFHLAIISPAFQDLVPGTGTYVGTLPEFTIMDNVVAKAPIIDIKRKKNILQRRDASCDLNYKKLMGASVRQITVDELYGAVQHCRNAFYQEALKDWRNNDPLFGAKIQPFFNEAIRTDILSNAWFGDITRITNPASEWSTTMFDGIFKWIKLFYQGGVIPAGQSMAMPDVDMRANPAQAYAIIKGLYDKQSPLMRSFAPNEMAFYVTQAIADGYQDYLLSLGVGDANTFAMFANGVKIYSYKSIPIMPEPLWEPILTELIGANKNAAILTIRGNFIFGTDKNYGEGEDGKTALMVWYEKKDLSFYFQQFLKGGTMIALPEHICFSVSA